MKWLKSWAKKSWSKAVLFMLIAMCGTGLNIAFSPKEPVEKKDDKLILTRKAAAASNISNWEQVISVDSYSALAKKTILRKTESSEIENNLEDSHINYTIRSCISALLSNYKEDSHVQQAFSSCSRELMQFIAVIISMPSSLNSTIQVEIQKPVWPKFYKLIEIKISQMQSRWNENDKKMYGASLGFIKPYKVGGSTISTLLNSYSISQNETIQPKWPAPGKTLGNGNACFDIVGTHHPKKYFYQSTFQKAKLFFCNELVLFTLVRDPVERIWSGYNHYVKVKNQIQVSLQGYLKSRHDTLLPPHQLISERLKDALHLSKDLLILSSDGENMDKSLVLLSKKANLSLCDVLYLPCSEKEGSDWGATKCNNYKKELNKTSKELIIRHLRSTSEAEFYNHSMKIYQQQLKDHDVQTTLKRYLQIRTKAVKACSSEMSKTAWLKVFMADPRITGKSPTFRLRADNCYLVSPLWVCMQMYCRHSNIDL